MEDEEVPIQRDWIDKAKTTFRFHRNKLSTQSHWTATLTARVLHRSIGSVSNDLKIARWLRTHEAKVSSFKYAIQALEWIHEEEKKMELRPLDE